MTDKYIKIEHELWKKLRYEAFKREKTIKALTHEIIVQALKRARKVKELFKTPK